MRFKNPVIPGFNPDPSVCRVGNEYYLVTSSFEFFPGVPLYRSVNLTDWELIGHCLTRQEQAPLENCPSSKGIYAPTIRYFEGIFYMTTTNTNTRGDGSRYGNFIVHTRDIRGAWSDPVYVEQGGIDPSLLFDGGKVWFCSNGGAAGQTERGIYLCEIDPLTGETKTPTRLISTGTGAKCTEAPHIYHRNGWYYLVLAEGGTEYGHMVTAQRSRSIYGPYEDCPHNPVLSHRYRHRFPIQAVGHADFFEDSAGNWWLVCLGIRIIDTQELHHLGRETFLAPLRWENDWPVAESLELEMTVPLEKDFFKEEKDFLKKGKEKVSTAKDAFKKIKEDFSGSTLPACWMSVRKPVPYRLDQEKLFLTGTRENLSDLYPVCLCVRQQSFRIEAVTTVAVSAQGVRAGMTAFYNDSYHYDFALERNDDGFALLVNRRMHDLEAVTFRKIFEKIPDEGIELRITSDPQWYYFWYRLSEGGWQDCGKAMTAGLCSEGTWYKTFTGVCIGLFSIAGEASFSGFSLENF